MKLYLCLLVVATAPLLPGADATVPAYRIETVAGSSNIGDGGPAPAAQIGSIQGIAVDRLGNLYLSDTDHNRVRKVSTAGTIATVAGTGDAGFGGDGGAATAAQLNLPYGLAVDLMGNVYIADLGNNRVRRVGADGIITTLAGTGVKGSGGDGGPAASAQLLTPRNVVIDAYGNIFISEFEGHRVRKVSPDGKISTAAGSGSAGYRGDGGAPTSAQLNYPAGLAMDRTGNLYIADSQNNRIRKLLPGGAISTVLGATGGLTTPHSVAVDGPGTIYVADSISTMVYAYTTAGKRIQFAGGSVKDFQGDGGAAAKADLTNILDLAVDLTGNVWLADGQRVRMVDTAGIIRTVAGDGYRQSLGDLGSATDAILYRPSAVALDGAGNLFISDTGTGRVRQVLPARTIVTLAAGLAAPMGVAVDPQGNVAVADAGSHRILKAGQGSLVTVIAGTGEAGTGPEYLLPTETQLRAPGGICLDRAGTLLIVDTSNHRVLRAAPSALTEIAAGNGSPGDAGDGGRARAAQVNLPGACTLDSFGNLFIADTMNHRIREVTPGGTITTVAGTGTAGGSGDEGPATQARLNTPKGIAVNDSGDIFIADTGNHRIRQVTSDGVIHTVAGGAIAGFKGDGGKAAAALLASPGGLFLDGAGTLYLADTDNHRVRRLVPDPAAPATPAAPPAAPVVLAGLPAVNAASLKTGPTAPGEIIILYGKGIGPDSGVAAAYDSAAMLPTLLGAMEVRFDGTSAPLLYAQSGEIHVVAPYALAGRKTTHVDILYQGKTSASLDLAVAASAPGLYPVAVNADGSPNSAANPAAAGSLLTLYATGEGLTDGANITGQAAQAPYPHPALPVKLTIGGAAAEIVDAFSTPGVAGMLQVNARVPAASPKGAAAVSLSVGGAVSQEITVSVK